MMLTSRSFFLWLGALLATLTVFTPAQGQTYIDPRVTEHGKRLDRIEDKIPTVEKEFRDKFNGSSLFSRGDFADPLKLARKLAAKGDPLSAYLQGQMERRLTPEARLSLTRCVVGSQLTEECLTALTDGLDEVLREPSLFNQERFKNVTLSEETKLLIEKKKTDEELVRLNRTLLEEAYPDEIAKNPFNRIDAKQARIEELQEQQAQDIRQKIKASSFNIDRFWVLLAAVLVFFMQAGFKSLEVGMVRKEFDTVQAAQKLFSWIATYVGYFPLGFGLMFAATNGGLIGSFQGVEVVTAAANKLIIDTNNAIAGMIPGTDLLVSGTEIRGLEFFLFQAAFAATAVTIPAGATAERMKLAGYILLGVFIAAWVYPVFGHWAWGGSTYSYYYPRGQEVQAARYLEQTAHLQGWLQKMQFHDFAGSTVVHSVGGWFALFATYFLGPREGRFNEDGSVNTKGFPVRSRGYAILGVFMLWFGWWGFNGGSQLRYDTSIAGIILNTNLAGAAAGLAAYLFGYFEEKLLHTPGSKWFQKGFIPEKTIGGVLGGLVAITASCDLARPSQAILIGLAAGIVHNLAFNLLLRCKIDDPVGAIPVHAFCGVLGTLLVAFTYQDISSHLVVQLIGVLAALGWTGLNALIFFLPFRLFSRRANALQPPEGEWT